ncbi:Phosphoserine phosphatase rsbX [Rhodovastum atsumiense]|uniref:SpoIIE family protein phosphatase n=1 Tax=Rhodovastum atsumiense TaxID=504468 RepID=A0A5M6J2U3_9PROT|nr:ATP-binding protein [Rhodovastum atsumiense]KAA5613918.1 SpoIIE family protein phosphatase [Rhodovastum atsumiense]CAH2602050.1 Phosphoserine phosphatase rsbX [Rhodovastum atsumiense]
MLPAHCHLPIAVAQAGDLAVARATAAELAADIPLGAEGRHRFDLIVAELGSNLVRHAAQGGMLLFRRLDDPAGVECLCLDRGPGIADPATALRDGESGDHGLGLGLGAVRRLSDGFALHSTPDTGTAILARVQPAPRRPADFAAGAVMVPMAGQADCGDGWLVTANGMAAVIDGLGHGEPASLAARAAEAAIAGGHDNPAAALGAMHLALRGTRGAVAAAALLTEGQIRFAGIGNIGAVLIRAGVPTHLTSAWGVLGYNARRAPVQVAPWSPGDVLLLHSDGLGHVAEAFTGGRLHGLDPALAAAIILRDAASRLDDRTVLVLAHAAGP